MFLLTDFLYKRICCGYPFELHRQVDAIQIGTHNICLYKNINKKYTGCNLTETGLHDCALIGVCAVIRSNMALKVSRYLRKWIWCVLNKDSAQAAYPHSLISLLYLPKCAQWRFWSDRKNAQADLNLHWAHMSEGTVSGVASQLCWGFSPSQLKWIMSSTVSVPNHREQKQFWQSSEKCINFVY